MNVMYRNELNKEIILNQTPNLKIIDFEGIDGLENTVNSFKGIKQDGSTYYSSYVDEREITITLRVKATSNLYQRLKNEIISIFNLKQQGDIIFTDDNLLEKRISVRVIQSPKFKVDGYKKECIISFIALDPYIKSINTSKIISTWTGGMAFKFSLPFKLKDKGETKINIYNEGHVDTPVRIIFGGPAVNPVIYNRTTGEFIKVKTTLLAGEKLIINTEYGNKTVEIDRSGVVTNAFNLIDLDSTFFSLVVGDNLIEYTTDNINDTQQVEIQYKFRYIGV